MPVVKALKSIIRKNSAGADFIRRRINLIEGDNITLTIADDPTDNEIDVTIDAAAGTTGDMSTATFYDATGGVTLTTSYSTLNLDTTLTNNDLATFSLSGDEITIGEDGFYLIDYNVGVQQSGGTRGSTDVVLQVNTGGGFADVTGTEVSGYWRQSSGNGNDTSKAVGLELNDGDIVRVRHKCSVASCDTIADRSSITFVLLTGAVGPQGPAGTSPLTTKGDLFTYDTDDQRLGVGTNRQRLQADSSTATGLAWANQVESGSTVPTSPNTGDMFLHTPTGRTILLQYDGTNWEPIHGFGDITIVVDENAGTDSIDKGFGVGADAVASIQFAVDLLPSTITGDVDIAIYNGPYNENVVIAGKDVQGDYEIGLRGFFTTTGARTTTSGSVQGSGATRGTVEDSVGGFTTNSERGKFVFIDDGTNANEVRCIVSNDTNTLTIAGTWPNALASGVSYRIFTPATTVDSFDIGAGQSSVVLRYLEIDGGVYPEDGTQNQSIRNQFGCQCTLFGCQIDCRIFNEFHTGGWLIFERCTFLNGNGDVRLVQSPGKYQFVGCFMRSNVAGIRAISLSAGTFAKLTAGTTIDMQSATSSWGLQAFGNAYADTFSSAADGYIYITNCATYGIRASSGGQVGFVSNNQYSGNGTNESADATNYGAISTGV